jgi:putative ATP-dependent endonuclease of OLD family
MFRKKGEEIKVLYLKEKVSQNIPPIPKILAFCKSNSPKYVHDGISSLTVYGPMNEKETKQLIKYIINHEDGEEIAKKITQLSIDSKICIPLEEIPSLQTYIKRIRGEILFAKGWLLCEGQSEYLLLPFFADLMNKPLDEYGISLIDFQNNGSAGIFPVVARIFEIPWVMICDTDQAGLGYIENLRDRGFSEEEIADRAFNYPEKDTDIELFLINNGFEPEYLELFKRKGVKVENDPGDEDLKNEIAGILRGDKIEYMRALINLLKEREMDASRIPEFFKNSINKIIDNAGKHGDE